MLFVRNLEYEEKPNYEMMRQKFRKVLHDLHQNRKEEIPLDWRVLRDRLRDHKRQEKATKSGLNYQPDGQLFISDIEKQTGGNKNSSMRKDGSANQKLEESKKQEPKKIN